MYVTEDYNKYFNLDFPAPVRETRLNESASSDLLLQLEVQLEAEGAELEELKKKYDAAFIKHHDELASDPEYQKLVKEYRDLDVELSRLERSYRVYDPYDRDGHDWEMDERIYEKVKDRIAELNQKIQSLKADYWKPHHEATAKAEAEFPFKAKQQAHSDLKDTRAKTLQALITEETPEVERLVAKLNSDCKASCDPQFKASFKTATFKNGVLTIPICSGRIIEDIYDNNELEDFDVEDDYYSSLEPDNYTFDTESYFDRVELEIHPDQIAEECGYKPEDNWKSYRIDDSSDWLLSDAVDAEFTEVPEVTDIDVYDGAIEDFTIKGNIKYYIVCYLFKNFK